MRAQVALHQAVARLESASDSARADAEVLIAHVIGCTRASVAGRAQQELTPEQSVDYARLIERRAQGCPVAYLTGHKEFWSLDLGVNPEVLIPRPETELLVEWSLERFRDAPPARVADLGTGSGAIALALAQEWPRSRVTAVDASMSALETARENAHRLELPNLDYVHATFAMFLRHGDRYDLLVGNPPYVADDDPCLTALAHEPRHALVSGADGLDALREIARGAAERLRHGGWLLLEHGATQGDAVRALLRDAGFETVETRKDLAGRERCTGGCRP